METTKPETPTNHLAVPACGLSDSFVKRGKPFRKTEFMVVQVCRRNGIAQLSISWFASFLVVEAVLFHSIILTASLKLEQVTGERKFSCDR